MNFYAVALGVLVFLSSPIFTMNDGNQIPRRDLLLQQDCDDDFSPDLISGILCEELQEIIDQIDEGIKTCNRILNYCVHFAVPAALVGGMYYAYQTSCAGNDVDTERSPLICDMLNDSKNSIAGMICDSLAKCFVK